MAMLSAVDVLPTPRTYKEAMSPASRFVWGPSIQTEWSGMVANHTWELLYYPTTPGANILHGQWSSR